MIGGGKVAYRKICGLIDAGAKVEVIAPEICTEIEKLFEDGKIYTYAQSHYRTT